MDTSLIRYHGDNKNKTKAYFSENFQQIQGKKFKNLTVNLRLHNLQSHTLDIKLIVHRQYRSQCDL